MPVSYIIKFISQIFLRSPSVVRPAINIVLAFKLSSFPCRPKKKEQSVRPQTSSGQRNFLLISINMSASIKAPLKDPP